MHFKASTVVSLLLASTALAGSLPVRNEGQDDDDKANIFKEAGDRW